MAYANTLDLRGIGKVFPGVVALDGIDLSLQPGEIHALLGENGAGKSTLIKILTGVYQADSGETLADGRPVAIGTPRRARELGITLVPQDILMVPELSIGRNILLGLEGWRATARSLSAGERALVRGAIDRVGVRLDPDARAGALSVPHLRLAQIARALLHPGAFIVLDEPTAVLSEPDAEHLLRRLEAFRDEGKAILYVTHRLSEVMRLADRMTILRDGRKVGHFKRGEIDRDGVVQLMAKVGASPLAARPAGEAEAEPGKTILSVEGLGDAEIAGVSIQARAGEVIGIAGVQGSGHGRLLRLIAGVDRAESGSIRVDGTAIGLGSVAQAYRRGVLLVPADRRGAGIVGSQSVRENISMSRRVRKAVRRFGLRISGRERSVARSYVDSLGIRPGSTEARTGTLSGGNQQKVALARILEAEARVLLVEEPTQGIDIRTKAEIHAILRDVARDRNCAVVVASSEFEELIGLVSRIHVMRMGRLVATLPGTGTAHSEILRHALP